MSSLVCKYTFSAEFSTKLIRILDGLYMCNKSMQYSNIFHHFIFLAYHLILFVHSLYSFWLITWFFLVIHFIFLAHHLTFERNNFVSERNFFLMYSKKIFRKAMENYRDFLDRDEILVWYIRTLNNCLINNLLFFNSHQILQPNFVPL